MKGPHGGTPLAMTPQAHQYEPNRSAMAGKNEIWAKPPAGHGIQALMPVKMKDTPSPAAVPDYTDQMSRANSVTDRLV